MKTLFVSILFLFFLQACTEAEQDAVVDRQVERSTEKILDAIKEDNDKALEVSKATEPVKKDVNPDEWVTFDPQKGMREKMAANAEKAKAEAAKTK